MQDLAFVSESYSKKKPKDYNLSISIRRDGFSFLIAHKKEVKAYSYVTAHPSQREERFKAFLNQDILKEQFASVTIIIVTPRYTLVPQKFFDETLLETFSDLNFTKQKNESVITYESSSCDAVVLFPIETNLWAMCREAFRVQEYVSYVPQLAPLLEANIKTRKEKLCVSVENNFFTAVFIKEKQLRYSNSFHFSNVNDFLFYLMNIFNSLHLDPLTTPVELSGKISKKSPYFSALQVFVKQVDIVSTTERMPERFPYMLFYNHCNIGLCE